MSTAPAPQPVESYDHVELDQLAGSLLWLGRLHNSLASFLDVTYDPADTGLVEFLNLVPVSMTLELLPTTDMLLSEVVSRSQEIQRALSAAMDSTAERAVTEGTKPADTRPTVSRDTTFAEIIDLAFKRDAKKNGGA